MKAALRHVYGSPDDIELGQIDKPTPGDEQLLIRVHAVSLNLSDVECLTGSPAYARIFGLFKPRFPVLGTDVVGTVEAVGRKVTKFQPGDQVMGDMAGFGGALAEYTCAPEKTLIYKPASMGFELASTLPQAGCIALQAIRDRGRVQAGQKVLINGAGGGSGTLAIQLAKHFGAEVTGVDNGHKLDVMRSVGADHVVDYTREDFTRRGQRYDLILDLVAHRSIFDHARVLAPGGTYFLVGGAMVRLFQSLIVGPLLSLGSKKMGVLGVTPNRGLSEMVELCQAGTVVPVIDEVFALSEAADALRYVMEGRARGKVVVRVLAEGLSLLPPDQSAGRTICRRPGSPVRK